MTPTVTELSTENATSPEPSFEDTDLYTNRTSADIALIIPFRNRTAHLDELLRHLLPFLNAQNVSSHIFVVEQIADQTFNKGKLMNVGFLFAKHWADFPCYIFHDVDLLPEDSRNLYQCGLGPRHLSVTVDTLGYK
ncbi:unnamed protein product [Soboliphyme baturini]|uniref:Glyco_transf_7N domain-containing protein n=1 Tax=Soboliphyme baturini TaxID=241478 RepID=A0A183I9N2_9BILA|nr:unnamed protein product [Soboliphyme baturini]